MALFNYATKEITLKIVYYGPGLSGKTTNLQYLHSSLDPERRGKLLSLSTEADRTLFFDFMPVELGRVKGFSIRFQLYTVPGQVRYNATRKLVLKGADAVVFVADSQAQMIDENLGSLKNMRENLLANNLDPDDIPVVFQYNKRDLPNVMPVGELNSRLNTENNPFFEAVAIEGKGVNETFQSITRALLKHISSKHKIDIKPQAEETVAPSGAGRPSPVKEKPAVRPGAARISPIDKSAVPSEGMPGWIEIEKDLASLKKAIAGNQEMKEEIARLGTAVENLVKTMENLSARQDEAASILLQIKESIESARTKKRWFLFG